MSVPRIKDTYVDSNYKKFIVTGMEVKDDGFYTYYRDEQFNSYSCSSDAFNNRFTILENYDCSSRNNSMGK